MSQIVLCGSMSAYPVMRRLAEELRRAGVGVVLPDHDDVPSADEETACQVKAAASRQHFARIQSPETAAVLVVNVDRHNTPNYVGPNSFAEAAVAVAHDRPVFLLQGIPAAYADELTAWGATPLNGDLSQLGHRLHARLSGTSAADALVG
jgi:hypothetical protein